MGKNAAESARTRDLPGRAWIEDVWVRTELAPDQRSAVARIRIEAGGAPADVGWVVTDPSGHDIVAGTGTTADGEAVAEIPVTKLRPPDAHGTPELYELAVGLSIAGEMVDARTCRFAIRDVPAARVNGSTEWDNGVKGNRPNH